MEDEKKQEEVVKPVEEAKEEIPTPPAEVIPEPVLEEPKAEEKIEKIVEEEKEEEPKIEEVKESKIKGEKRWYVIQTYSGSEEKVLEALKQTLEILHLEDVVTQILIPEEEIVELKGRKRIEKKRKMFPGYVFLEMILTDETWYAIGQTPGVSRFIGTKVKPTPVSGREMQRVLKQIGAKEEKLEIAFKKSETIRVVSGPFRGFTGIIDEINADKEKLKVLINIFGRDTPVEVNFEHAEKIV